MNRRLGLIVPLRRAARDFETGAGSVLLGSKVRQVLLTDPGELPWRTSFGAGLGRLRHQNNDAVLRELARVSVRDALTRWMRGVRVVKLETKNAEGVLAIELAVAEAQTGEGANLEAML
jgi:phage baseplate assembly protein W